MGTTKASYELRYAKKKVNGIVVDYEVVANYGSNRRLAYAMRHKLCKDNPNQYTLDRLYVYTNN